MRAADHGGTLFRDEQDGGGPSEPSQVEAKGGRAHAKFLRMTKPSRTGGE